MLVESLIKETVNLQGFRLASLKKEHMNIVAEIIPDHRFSICCGVCGTPGKYRDIRPSRLFRHVPLWNIPVWFEYSPRRVFCPFCQSVRVEAIPWAASKKRFTTAFSCFLATWAKLLPWYEVGRLFKCAWGTVASAVDTVVEHGLLNRDLGGVTHIGIDEISRKKGHVYLTNVYDLQRKTLIWSGEGRTKETLRKFFDYFGPENISRLQGICCDMWQPYIDVIAERAPQATLVFDKFHIVQHLMKAVDQVRRDEIREKGKEHKDLMKDSRYIWLKNPWNLTDKQKIRLGFLEKLNLKINRAYLLKEAFRNLWTYELKPLAQRYLERWFWWATHSRLKPMRDFAWLVRRHEQNIFTYFDQPINNAAVEGLNNKAKIVSHRAYGFRSPKNYIRNLYLCMADLPMPQLLHTFV